MLSAGTRLGPYEILSPLGAGGMGEVFKARDTRLDRSVAIKILPAEFAENAQFKIRFEREAKAISQLNHPNICTLYDVGENYLVMELLEGESLADRLARGPLPLNEVVKYGVHIAEALEKAHRAGIIHRDLKPGNVMLTKSGAKLLDFGLARQSVFEMSADGATQQKPLTQEGTILGTFQYMAPEQLESAEADARTDIFAFGALLFEMSTGKRAFEGKTKTSLIAAIVGSSPPPVSRVRPVSPRALDHVVARCLEKDPDQRWQNAHDIGEELRWIGEETTDTVPAKRSRWRELLAWGIAAIAVVAATAFVTSRKVVTPPSYSFLIPPSTSEYESAFGGIISPDGRTIAFSAERRTDGNRIIWVRDVDSLEARPLPAAESWSSFFWSHDSRHIFFGRTGLIGTTGKLQKLAVDGGTPQVIGEFPPIAGGDTNSDGDVIVAANRALGIHRITKSGALVPVTTLDASHNEQRHNWPMFLPDGRHFLFIGVTLDPSDPGSPHRLYVGSLDGASKYIGPISSRVQYVEPGYLLFVRDGTLLSARFDIRKFEIVGEPVTVADDVWYTKSDGNADFWVSKTGTLVVKGSGLPWEIDSVTPQGRISRSLGAITQAREVDISPDGSSISLAMPDSKVANFDLWIWGLDRTSQRRLTFRGSAERAPVWSPDGTQLYFSSDVKSEPDIYVRAIEGSGEETLVVSSPNIQAPRDVSPDGRYLLYQSYEDPATDGDLMILSLDGKEQKPFPFVKTPFRDGATARFSPDGRWIVYESSETGDRTQVYVKPFPSTGSSRQVSPEVGFMPRWGADGKRIYYLQDRRKLLSARFDPATGTVSESLLVTELPRNLMVYDVAPDGSFVVIMAGPPDTWPPNRVFTDWTRLMKEK